MLYSFIFRASPSSFLPLWNEHFCHHFPSLPLPFFTLTYSLRYWYFSPNFGYFLDGYTLALSRRRKRYLQYGFGFVWENIIIEPMPSLMTWIVNRRCTQPHSAISRDFWLVYGDFIRSILWARPRQHLYNQHDGPRMLCEDTYRIIAWKPLRARILFATPAASRHHTAAHFCATAITLPIQCISVIALPKPPALPSVGSVAATQKASTSLYLCFNFKHEEYRRCNARHYHRADFQAMAY